MTTTSVARAEVTFQILTRKSDHQSTPQGNDRISRIKSSALLTVRRGKIQLESLILAQNER